jgi:U2 small nuclear ribonucleoprotein A'
MASAGLGIPSIENTGAANDQFQCIDLSDNDISLLGGFALMKRLRTLVLHNNPITSVSVNVSRTLPFLTTLIMSDNKLEMFADVDRLAGLRHLDTLVLVGNSITQKRNYRLYTIYKIPSLQTLDYQQIRLAERRAAKKLFESEAGQKFDEAVKEAAVSQTAKREGSQVALPTDAVDRMAAIKKAVEEAKSEEELARLDALIGAGVVPDASDSKKRVSVAADGGTAKSKRART